MSRQVRMLVLCNDIRSFARSFTSQNLIRLKWNALQFVLLLYILFSRCTNIQIVRNTINITICMIIKLVFESCLTNCRTLRLLDVIKTHSPLNMCCVRFISWQIFIEIFDVNFRPKFSTEWSRKYGICQ